MRGLLLEQFLHILKNNFLHEQKYIVNIKHKQNYYLLIIKFQLETAHVLAHNFFTTILFY